MGVGLGLKTSTQAQVGLSSGYTGQPEPEGILYLGFVWQWVGHTDTKQNRIQIVP